MICGYGVMSGMARVFLSEAVDPASSSDLALDSVDGPIPFIPPHSPSDPTRIFSC